MSLPRFFIDDAIVPGTPFSLGGEDARHISRSLRMRVGERLVVCSGGTEYDCVIQGFTAATVALMPESSRGAHEPPVRVGMYIAVPKSEKLDFCVQKCVELGASEIVPFWADHCVTRGGSAETKAERRQKIAAEAAKQCGRGFVPPVLPVLSFEEALRRGAAADLLLFCSEKEDASPLSAVLRGADVQSVGTVSVFTGPEGGFSQKEFDKAAEIGYNMITLGNRILRCETAPLCVLSALMFAFGEF